MTHSYGELYRCADFLNHAVEKGSSAESFGKILNFLKDLDLLQSEVATFFFRVRAGGSSGGISIITRDGLNDFLILPRRNWLKVSTYCDGKLIKSYFKGAARNGEVESLETREAGHSTWRVELDRLGLILSFLRELDPFDDESENFLGSRSFPMRVKQAALNLHETGGYVCAGADGRSPHTVSSSNFEFDHRYPFSKDGLSEAWNIQVLCRECNRKKGAKVWDWQSKNGFTDA